MRKYLRQTIMVVLAMMWATTANAEIEIPRLEALSRMPVKEVTVFKDGHAFVLHSGKMPTDTDGSVLMDYLPTPVLGTFWPYTNEKSARLTSVTAGQRRVTVQRSPLTIRELIEANPGAEVVITETQNAASYPATILSFTGRSWQELESVAPANSGELLAEKGNVVLLQTAAGVKAVELSRIQDVTFKETPKNACNSVEFRNLLTLKLDWGTQKPTATADVGLMYLQRGIRWIPHYKITIDGKGSAVVQLQATLLNELTDLEDATCHLVIGVPTFQFKNTTDPIALQQSLAQLSQYFQESDPTAGQYQMLSNTLMTQAPRMGEYRQREPAAAPDIDLGPDVAGADNVEDLHIFTVKNVTLRKGQRMVVPVTEVTVPYQDVFVLELPFAPPADAWSNFNTQQQAEIARLLASPKAIHKLRLTNKSEHPFTTAPALIVRENRVLGQGLMTYTSTGGSTDLPITAAVDIRIKKSDGEIKRTPNATNWDGNSFARIDLTGTLSLTNFRKNPVQLEIVRHVLGNITEASNDGKIAMVNVFEDSTYTPAGDGQYPRWWGWWSWPHWWGRLNGVGRINWAITLDSGKSIELKYAWNYFWR